MNCLDCLSDNIERTAVATCTTCGAAVCADHADMADQPLTHQTLGGMVTVREPVTPTARVIRCGRCAAAHTAAQHPKAS
ncbi:MAG TPA: DUF2180 family protein [Streptosporangiaceae bacterium]|jgi:hypothetical protein